jgi:hypothetical protein
MDSGPSGDPASWYPTCGSSEATPLFVPELAVAAGGLFPLPIP